MKKLIGIVIFRFALAIVVFALLFFLTSGTLAYWQAWVFCGVLFVPMLIVLVYLLNKDPKLLERRMRTKEKEAPQSIFIKLSLIIFVIEFIIPGLDFRFGWSFVPISVVIVADILVFIGYSIFFLVLRENSYASRVVEVEQGQKVISTGLYAVVRHPMYLAVLLIYMFAPLALGSFWALIAVIPIPILLVLRILNEEKVLARELSGYEDYTKKVRCRLLPLVW